LTEEGRGLGEALWQGHYYTTEIGYRCSNVDLTIHASGRGGGDAASRISQKYSRYDRNITPWSPKSICANLAAFQNDKLRINGDIATSTLSAADCGRDLTSAWKASCHRV
jgi:hypothetical protein